MATAPATTRQAPETTHGVALAAQSSITMPTDFGGIDGHQLHVSMVTFEPGAATTLHSHSGRLGVVHVLEGVLTEYMADGTIHEHRQGESWSETGDVSHWLENRGTCPVRLMGAAIFKP